MKRNVMIIGVVAIVAVVAVLAYVFRTPEEASAPIEAIPIAETTDGSGDSDETVQVESPEDDDAMGDEPQDLPETEGDAAEPDDEEAVTEDAVDPPADSASGNVFSISQEDSQVSFSIDEILRGNPITAVGTTNQVAGEIALDMAAPLETQVGSILINARTLSTDSDFRNRAIQNEILDTAEYEFITFTPKQIVGLPDTVAVGDTVTLQLIGDLTIRDFTNEETFELTVTVMSDSMLEGAATATVLRSNYDLQIPDVQSVAGVSDEVLLEITFVAVK